MQVTKRNGGSEPLNLEKYHKVVDWAAEGLDNISRSDIEIQAASMLYDGISTSELHQALIKAAINLMDESSIEYGELASRLTVFKLRKDIFNSFNPPKYKDFVYSMVDQGFYDSNLAIKFSEVELLDLSDYIDHSRDMNIPYGGIKQLQEKYLLQIRSDEGARILETPQLAMMSIALSIKNTIPEVKELYDALSTFSVSFPTPIMAGLRSKLKQFSSCVLVESGDSLRSINATASVITTYASQRAGLGINAGAIRAKGDPVRNGETAHTGVIPFYQYFMKALKSCSQGGVRGASATLFYPIWHKEFEDLIVLKNNKGTEFNRARQLDYGVQINAHINSKLLAGEDLYLYSPADVPGMYEAFFSDPEKFIALYEGNANLAKRIPAIKAYRSLVNERGETARIYVQDVDNTNIYGTFNPLLAPVRQSNLCLEITLPTKPLDSVDDPNGVVSLCTLAALNLGNIETESDIERLMSILVRTLDEILDYQDYPVPAALNGTLLYRPLGIGVIDYAHWLAKQGFKYSTTDGDERTNWLFEAIAFYGIKASIQLAKEKGACLGFNNTKWAQGILPCDNYPEVLDQLVSKKLNFDWDSLREDLKLYGIRNATITALMPSETSSQVSGATNGIEPPRELISIKSSKDGNFKQPVPELYKLKDKYELLWTTKSIRGYLHKVAIMQKWVCQSISTNTSYNPFLFPNEKIPESVVLGDILYASKLGIKTLYYHNNKDVNNVEKEDDCASGACKI